MKNFAPFRSIHRLLSRKGNRNEKYNPAIDAANDTILEQMCFKDEDIAGRIAASKRPIVFIGGSNNNDFAIDNLIADTIFARNSKVVFQNKIHHESFSSQHPRWTGVHCSYLNHIGRGDDDAIYSYCQEICMHICNNIEVTFDNQFREDFTTLKNYIAYAAADTYSSLLRTSIMLLEQCHIHDCDLVAILGPKLPFSLALARTLEANGVACIVGKPPALKDANAKALIKAYASCNIAASVKFSKLYADLNHATDDVTRAIEGAEIVGLLRVKDPVYLQNIECVVEYLHDHRFCIIDRQIDDDFRQLFAGPDGSRHTNSHLCQLTSKTFFLSPQEADLLKQDIVAGVASARLGVHSFGNYALDVSFLLQGLSTLSESIVRAVFYFRVFQKSFARNRPRTLMVSPSRTLEARGAIEAARSLGITSFELQCGTLAASRRYWPPSADYVLCSDPVSAKIYRNFFHIDPSSILLVGSPRLDRNISPYREAARNTPLSGFRVFLVLQTVPVDVSKKMIEFCATALAGIENATLTIAFHPKESERSKRILRDFVDRLALDASLAEGDSLAHLVHHDVCVTYFSFLGVEAFGIGCDVIALNVTDHDWPYRLSELGVAREARSAEELAAIFAELQRREERVLTASGLEEDPASVLRDGRSMQRIAEALFSLSK